MKKFVSRELIPVIKHDKFYSIKIRLKEEKKCGILIYKYLF